MDKVLDKIRESIEGPMKKMNIIVDNVEYVMEGNYR